MRLRLNIFPVIALILVLVTTGIGCRTGGNQEAIRPMKITWWRVFDDSDTVNQIINDYRQIHPNIAIEYRKLRPEEYEQELLNALAEDRGPDIFTVHNTAMVKWQSKMLPLPRELTVAYQVVKGSIKKETVVEVRKERSLRTDQLRNLFVDQVANDVILPYRDSAGVVTDQIFGLPLALDTMVLYWNRDLLNAARIPEPARTWEEFLNHVQQLTKLDTTGKIIQAAAAIGTADNIERSTDLLSLIMMQNGAEMTANGAASFDRIPSGETRDIAPGLEALRFYTDFSNPVKKAYTWNDAMPNSLDAFTGGTVAYFFGYAYHLPLIRARAPRLNFSVARVPQVDPGREINFANYWIEGVSNKTKQPNEAWDFLQFATKAEEASHYLAASKKPTALRSLITDQLEDLDLSVFASEVLTAKSWYKGNDPAAAEAAIRELIRNVVLGTVPIEEAIRIAAGKVTQTMAGQ